MHSVGLLDDNDDSPGGILREIVEEAIANGTRARSLLTLILGLHVLFFLAARTHAAAVLTISGDVPTASGNITSSPTVTVNTGSLTFPLVAATGSTNYGGMNLGVTANALSAGSVTVSFNADGIGSGPAVVLSQLTGYLASGTTGTVQVTTFQNGSPIITSGTISSSSSFVFAFSNTVTTSAASPWSLGLQVVINAPAAASYNLTFSSVAISLPVIITQPISQTVMLGATNIFSVVGESAGTLGYQWLFNGSPIIGGTSSNFPVSGVQWTNAGNYSVVLTNLFGSITSSVAQLTVFSNLVVIQTNRAPLTAEIGQPTIPTDPTHFKVFTNGNFQSGIALDTNKMTVVLTHGFMSSPASWALSMASNIATHLSVPVPNIVAWDWSSEAGTNLDQLPVVTTKVLGEGYALANNLLAALGTNYSQPIHFLGHSLGTLVNSAAADYLHGDAPSNVRQYFDPANTQMTLFDEAELAPEILNVVTTQTFFHNPIPAHAVWIDNYISAFGFAHPQAANVILLKNFPTNAPDAAGLVSALTAFHGYPYAWYDDSISNATESLMGYRWSFEENGLTPPPATNTMFIQSLAGSELNLQPTNYDYGEALLIGRFPLYVAEPRIGQDINTVNGTVQAAGQVQGTLNNLGNRIVHLFTSTDGGAGTNTPAYAWIPLTVPPNAVSLSFDFMLQGDGNNDSFEAALNGTNVLSLETLLIQTSVTLNSGLIDVSQYAGAEVELFLGIVGGTSTNAELTVSDIQFYSAALPSLQVQGGNTNLVLSWPFSAQNFNLQSTSNLFDPTSWVTLSNAPAIVNLQNTITNSINGSSQFYRLKQ